MVYKTAGDFIKNVRSRKIGGISCYSLTQIAEGLGIDWEVIRGLSMSGELEKKLDFKFVEHPFNYGKYFPQEAVKKLYRFKDRLSTFYLRNV